MLLSVLLCAPLAIAAAPAAAQSTNWHGWTFVDSDPGVEITKLEVPFANTGGVNLRSVVNSSIAGATKSDAPPNGYTLNWPAGSKFKKGETITAQFNSAVGGVSMLNATAWNGAAKVGTIDDAGVLRNNAGVKIGQLAPALGVKPAAAEQAIIDRIYAWGATLGGAFADLDAHADAMADHYTNDASLLPTFGVYALYLNSPYVVSKPKAPVVRNYFRHQFLPKKPKLLPMNQGALRVVVAGNLASANGLYTFKTSADLCGGATPPKAAHARFTFVFRNENGTWKIVQHHSSANPSDPALGPVVGACLGDMDLDNMVDGADLGLLMAALGGASICGDLDGSGIVDGQDLGLLLAAWGPCP